MNEDVSRLCFVEDDGQGGDKNLTFRDPGPLPEKLTHVPGFVSELADFTMQTGSSPNRVLAFAGALTLLAHLSGRSCTDTHGTHTNLYMVVLGDSGIGKQAPRDMNVRIAERVDFSQSIAETFASGEAIEAALAQCPCMLLQADEVESLFGSMRGAGKTQLSMSDRIRRLFTSSGSIYTVRNRARARVGESGAKIMYPHLSIFGTGVPSEFLDSLTAEEITNGLFGRCLILRTDDQYVVQSAKAYVALPKGVVRTAEMLARRELDSIDSGVLGMHVVEETPEAAELLAKGAQAFMVARKTFAEMGLPHARAMMVRAGEKVAKLALLWAVSENPEMSVITRAAVEWAILFTTYVTKWMLFESQFHTGEGKFGRLKDRALKCFERNGGKVDKRTLIRSLGCDVGMLGKVLRTLLIAELIDGPEQIDGKVYYVLRDRN